MTKLKKVNTEKDNSASEFTWESLFAAFATIQKLLDNPAARNNVKFSYGLARNYKTLLEELKIYESADPEVAKALPFCDQLGKIYIKHGTISERGFVSTDANGEILYKSEADGESAKKLIKELEVAKGMSVIDAGAIHKKYLEHRAVDFVPSCIVNNLVKIKAADVPTGVMPSQILSLLDLIIE